MCRVENADRPMLGLQNGLLICISGPLCRAENPKNADGRWAENADGPL